MTKYLSSNEPRFLLLKASYSEGGKPLFKNQSDLAREIYSYFKNNEPDFKGSFDSVRSYLGLIIQGKRPASPKYLSAIISLVQQRIASKKDFQDWKESIVVGFDNLYVNRKLYNTPEKPLDGIFKRYMQAHHVVSVSSDPIESKGTGISDMVIDNFFESLDYFKTKKKFQPKLQYEFYYSSQSNAYKAWSAFIRRLQVRGKRKSQIENIIDEIQLGKLVIKYTEKENVFMSPLVVYDLNESRKVAFHFYYDVVSQAPPSYMRLSDVVLEHWKKSVYDEVSQNGIELDLNKVYQEIMLNDKIG